ncbi:hypothetical protein COLO4_26785 [Corchorus olitorius]|uniref:Uncharacterized protein n=1 Tax=Corchorus olitorius TaxID=93759 RepID=A0A1R3HUL9_9ROSI|nr:hypothetical protein COLO4_26785 [Corchorus olitorius]
MGEFKPPPPPTNTMNGKGPRSNKKNPSVGYGR